MSQFSCETVSDWEWALGLVFPGGSHGKESACNAGNLGSVPGLGRSPGEENGNPLQYSYLGNPMDRGASWATVHGVARVRHNFVTKPYHTHTEQSVNLPAALLRTASAQLPKGINLQSVSSPVKWG